MLIPKIISEYLIEITFEKLISSDSFHNAETSKKEEKYGTDSHFSRISKNEEPTFLYHYKKTLEAVNLSKRKNILDLGINKADEFDIIKALVDTGKFSKINLTGIDHSYSAIQTTKQKFPNARFMDADINDLDKLDLGKFDLVISIRTLQSPSINYKPF